MKKTYQGSCHCGAIQFRAELDVAAGTTRCNCRFCRKARFWMAFAKAAEFTLLKGEADLVDYQHTLPGKAEPFLHLTFCKHCGIRAFSKGGSLPQFGGEFYAVNVACLDGTAPEEMAAGPIQYQDGQHNAWDKAPAETRHL